MMGGGSAHPRSFSFGEEEVSRTSVQKGLLVGHPREDTVVPPRVQVRVLDPHALLGMPDSWLQVEQEARLHFDVELRVLARDVGPLGPDASPVAGVGKSTRILI